MPLQVVEVLLLNSSIATVQFGADKVSVVLIHCNRLQGGRRLTMLLWVVVLRTCVRISCCLSEHPIRADTRPEDSQNISTYIYRPTFWSLRCLCVRVRFAALTLSCVFESARLVSTSDVPRSLVLCLFVKVCLSHLVRRALIRRFSLP